MQILLIENLLLQNKYNNIVHQTIQHLGLKDVIRELFDQDV
jgi:hypothetical protein